MSAFLCQRMTVDACGSRRTRHQAYTMRFVLPQALKERSDPSPRDIASRSAAVIPLSTSALYAHAVVILTSEYNYPVMSPLLEMTLPFTPNCAVHIPWSPPS